MGGSKRTRRQKRALSERQAYWLACGAVLLVVTGVVGLALYLVFGGPSEPVRVAERFLSRLAEGRANDAYDDAAQSLRRRKTPDMLRLELRHLGLVSYARSSWPMVSVGDDEATLEGDVTTRTGEVVALVVTLVREEERWRVLAVSPAAVESGGEQPDEP